MEAVLNVSTPRGISFQRDVATALGECLSEKSTPEPSLGSPDYSLKRPDDVIGGGRKKNLLACPDNFAGFAHLVIHKRPFRDERARAKTRIYSLKIVDLTSFVFFRWPKD